MSSSTMIPVYNPSNEEQIAEVPDSDQAAVDAAVARARETFESGVWRKLPAAHRADVLFRAAEIIKARTAELAEIEARDNGMNAMAAQQIIKVANEMLVYYAGWVGKIHGESANLVSDGLLGHFEEYHTFTQLEPVGVVGLIIPWNGPFFVAMLKVAPALAAGCSAVLKPAEETPLSALELEGIFREAGLPDGVLNVITGYGETTGAALVAHPGVDKIAFTGSTEVGRLIVKEAAANLKRLTLELGGKSPLIMFDDADLDKAIMGAGMGLLAGSGQNCSCTSRIYVQRKIYDRFIEKAVARVGKVQQGSPLDPSTMIGAQASNDQLEKILAYIDIGRKEGAEVLTGGDRAHLGGELEGGFYVQPTVFAGHNKMRIFQEEIFGPVVSVTTFEDEAEALSIANDTLYGLGAGVWSRDGNRAYRFGRGIQAGRVWTNCYHLYPAHAAFGGYKQSGIGRENHKMMLDHYQQTKNLLVSYSPKALGFF